MGAMVEIILARVRPILVPILRKKGREGKATSDVGKVKDKNQKGCWTCGGDHLQRNFLKSAKVTAMIEERAKGSCFAPVNCIPMQLVSAINASALVVVNPGLMYVNIIVNGVAVLAMVDTGVNHKFVVECWYPI
nr:gag-asp_proteas domain-containing protein [Ipomoea batatas]